MSIGGPVHERMEAIYGSVQCRLCLVAHGVCCCLKVRCVALEVPPLPVFYPLMQKALHAQSP